VDRSRIAIVIPALNEQTSIASVIQNCLSYGTPIVVDDGSSDETGTVALLHNAYVVRHATNLGYDAALNSGFAKASELNFEVVVTIDADGQHNPGLIYQCVALFEAGADVVVGVRDQKARISEYCFALLTQVLYGITDPLCGLKAYRIGVYRSLGYFDSYQSIGTELSIHAARTGFKLSQFAVPIRERAGDAPPRFGRALKANYKIFRAMFICLLRAFGKRH